MILSTLRAGDVDDGHGAGPDVGGVGAAAIVREGEHVALGLAGWNCADDLQRLGIDDSNGLVELGGDVELAVLRPDHGAMRANAVIECDVADDLACGDVDDGDVGAVGARFPYPGVAVDGYKRQLPVG